MLRVHPGQIQQVLAGLSRKDQVHLRQLLERMESHLQSMSANRPKRLRESSIVPKGVRL